MLRNLITKLEIIFQQLNIDCVACEVSAAMVHCNGNCGSFSESAGRKELTCDDRVKCLVFDRKTPMSQLLSDRRS